ncbi:hypothetical protein [Halodesulfovibrio aestuarii]|uniref:PepSY domain-containing protein n=1 Tax=Halodesulfovibrio aestuarii TaxID=126333 RepID=A0ABV4JNM1_9BACT
MKVTLLKWSRFLHKWLGIYIAIFTILWVFELIILPSLYSVKPVVDSSNASATSLSIQQVADRIASGAYGSPEHMELRYQPERQHYIVADNSTFTLLTINAMNGQVISQKLDYDALLMKKTGLGWLNETLGEFLKIPFQIFFVILSITGLHLILFPHIKKKKAPEGLLALAPGQKFLFKSTSSTEDMAKTASIGLLPGVQATLLYIPRRGPVVISARNTRIAVARSVANSFIIAPVEA